MDTNLVQKLILIRSLREQKKYQESVDLAREITADNSLPVHAHVHAHLNNSITLRLMQDYPAALSEANQALSKNTDPNNIHFIAFEQAAICAAANDWKNALANYQKAFNSPAEPVDANYGLKNRYLEHIGYCQAKLGDPSGMATLATAIKELESSINSPEISKETGQFDRKYNLQVWLSKAYMHSWELGDKTVQDKLDKLFSDNPALVVRRGQWEELKNKGS